MPKLNYGQVYEFNISGKGYKGIYLGEKISENRFWKNNVAVLNNPSFNEKKNVIDRNFSVISFKKYAFRELYNDYLIEVDDVKENISDGEKGYLHDLCKKFKIID